MITADPFAELYETAPQTHIYISGRLDVLRVAPNTAGLWIHVNDRWYRRLDSHAFLWLRAAVDRAIESGKLAGEFLGAAETLQHIAAIGIDHGAFRADEIASHHQAPDDFRFSDDVPRWVEEFQC
jgi:hypothetical protein